VKGHDANSGMDDGGSAWPARDVSKGLRTKKIWRRIEVVERFLGLDKDRNSQDEILYRLLEELSPKDLLL
jgi:hypothetical protein